MQERDREIEEKTREVEENERELHYRQTRIEQLSHEVAILRRRQFGRRSEQLSSEQINLLDEAVDAIWPPSNWSSSSFSRRPPPPRHASSRSAHRCRHSCRAQRSTTSRTAPCASVAASECAWVCKNCETLIQAPVPAHVIDKGIPTAGLLASVLVAKYADHLPLYRQEKIFARAGLAIP